MCRFTARAAAAARRRARRGTSRGRTRREQQALVDAERADHLAVQRRRPHQRAPARPVEQQPQRAEHERAQRRSGTARRSGSACRRCRRSCRSPARAARAGPAAPRSPARRPAPSARRRRSRAAGTAPAPGRCAAAAATSISTPITPTRSAASDHAAPEARARWRRRERGDQRPGDIGAQHVERAMREVHDPRDAEDDRQPGRDEEQRGRARQPVQRLDEEEGEIGQTIDPRLQSQPLRCHPGACHRDPADPQTPGASGEIRYPRARGPG